MYAVCQVKNNTIYCDRSDISIDGFGRPTKDIYAVLCVLIFQQTHDLNDEEAVSQLAFNIQWHYVLNISEESDSDKYMCPKTLWDMRSIVVDNGLDTKLSTMYYISVSG